MRWRDGIKACEVDGRAILLDLRTGRYRAVSPAATVALRSVFRGCELSRDVERELRSLVDCGILLPRGPSKAWEEMAPPTGGLVVRDLDAIRWPDVLAAFLMQLAARSALRLLGFRRVYRLLVACGPGRDLGGPAASSVAIGRLARAMDRTELLISRRDRCLARTLAFRMLARVRGLDVRLVIGVRGSPFAAHCWAERDRVVLNDELATVAPFVPILSV